MTVYSQLSAVGIWAKGKNESLAGRKLPCLLIEMWSGRKWQKKEQTNKKR